MTTAAVFLGNLGLTILVEGAVVALVCRRWRVVYASFLCNLLTNPVLNLLLLLAVRLFGGSCYVPVLIVLEAAVVLLEAWILRLLCPFSRRQALALSLLMNACSYGAGALLYAVI